MASPLSASHFSALKIRVVQAALTVNPATFHAKAFCKSIIPACDSTFAKPSPHGDFMFTSGNLVVYPAQGVGEIEEIDHREIGGMQCDFYIVRIRANRVTLMVPVKNAASVGLRPLVSTTEAKNILEGLRTDLDKPVFTGQNWNRRFREYTERLKSSNLAIVSELLRELLLIGRTKELSFGERRLLEQAMNLVSEEIAEVLHLGVDELRDELMLLYAPVSTEDNLQEA